jgi:hypothetical protein
MRTVAKLMLGTVLALVAVPATAATAVYSLSTVDNGAGLGAGPFGTVTVEELGGSLRFTETLNSGVRIHDGNNNHNAFSFSLAGAPSITVSGLTAGFEVVAGAVTAPPFGGFNYAIDCTTACGPGFGGGFAGPLSFTVSAASALTLASLASTFYDNSEVFFATDLVITSGQTGNVGATVTPSAVPEPASWAMFIGGFGLIGGAMRRRQRGNVRFA